MTHQNVIRVAAVVILDRFHRVLTVRKEGTHRFMQPGGKPEFQETPQQTAVREVAEEIGLHLQPAQLVDLGTFSAQAANETNTAVMCHNFLVEFDETGLDLLDSLRPAAEIAELRWIALESLTPAEHLAPLLTEQVAPAVRALLKTVDSATR
ncbi:NUDIX hydrolase [Nesterenkonia haasae]|uniref:NUDIX hydrolase n=1 Tax=Nesterenkonia haasae TaxID=2587813 RepID=UPI0013912230|nr:NUDIX domain-containing protein [Nesterenkonia haasae]NDK30637.1 NUDIX domain-containing protein [Nesterenkonia haasae]